MSTWVLQALVANLAAPALVDPSAAADLNELVTMSLRIEAIVEWPINVLSSLVLGVTSAVSYFKLRALKEGVAVQDLAAVFD